MRILSIGLVRASNDSCNNAEFLNGEIFYSLKEAQILTERWRVHYNTVRPHSSLGYRPPAPMAYSLAIPQTSASRSPVSPVM